MNVSSSNAGLTPLQQAAVDAATKASGYFISYDLLKSKIWLEALIRGSAYFQDQSTEWIVERYYHYGRFPQAQVAVQDAAISPKTTMEWFHTIPENIRKELEQELVNEEMNNLLQDGGDWDLIIFYLLGAKPAPEISEMTEAVATTV